MTSLDIDVDGFTGFIDRLLRRCNRRCRLDCSTEDERRSVTHSTECTAGVVRRFLYLSVFHDKRIIVGKSGCLCGYEAVTNLKSLDSTNRYDRFGKVRIQFLEDRIPKTDRKTVYDAFNDSTGRILFV